MSTRKTLKDFLNNIKGIPQDSLTFGIDSNEALINEGDDLGLDLESGESLLDFNDGTKGMLGDYINFITSKNKQGIKQGNFKSVSPIRGNYPHSNPEDSGDPFLAQGSVESGLMSQYSNSEYFEGDVISLIDKIGDGSKPEPLKGITGQSISTSNSIVINPEGEDNPIVQASQGLLVRNNRFSPTNKLKVFKPNNISSQDFEAGVNEHGTMQVQNDFGDFDRSKFITNLDSLKNIGKSLLLKAGGWDSSDNILDSINPEQFDILNANSLLSQAGINNISNESVKAKNSFGFPADNEGNSARLGKGESSPSERSEKFGTFYNQEINHFDKNYDILRNHAAIALVAIKKAILIAFDQIETIGVKSRKKNGNALEEIFSDKTDSRVKGKYKPDVLHNVDFLKKKLFVKTIHSYYDCVDMGIRVLFTSRVDSKNEINDKNASKILTTDSHYWMSIFISVLKRSKGVLSSPFSSDESATFFENTILFVDKVKNSALLRFMNAIATVGDVHLTANMGKTGNEIATNPRDVDSLPTIPGTRVMKSRSGAINKTNLSFSGMNLPSAYILPLNVVGASLDMNTISKGANPSRGMLGSSLANKTYTAVGLQGSYNRIPIEVLKEMEDRYEAEYLPFYITDLRTNEIIAFHGFLTTLSDAINPSYNESTGYGRLDPIKTYGKTSRTVSFAFKLIATNPQDFDEMWYKINKLVTLFYPQYTDGDTIRKSNAPFDVAMLESATSAVFKQPFSQVIGATPLVRVRIGDVIKSNYSKFNLSRIFGAGDLGTNLRPSFDGNDGFSQILDTASALTNLSGIGLDIPGVGRLNVRDALLNIFASKYGSPIGKTSMTSAGLKGLNNTFLKSDFVNTAVDQISSKIIEDQAAGLINGFVNPIVINDIINKLIDPSLFAESQQDSKKGYFPNDMVFMKSSPEKFLIDTDGEKYLFNRNILCKVIGREIKNAESHFVTANVSGNAKYNKYTEYKLEVIDAFLGSIVGKKFKVSHSDIIPDYKDIYDQTYGKQISKGDLGVGEWLTKSSKSNQANDKNLVGKIASNAFNTAVNGPEAFMNSFYNPVTRAFETNMGRGLAGTLGGVTFNWLNDDYGWETEFNSRAPMGVDISLTLSVIHDIPPGLDHSGYNRAPLYNVGKIMKEVSGDPNDRMQEAEDQFNSQEGIIQRKIK
jgi:hypothetical protein